MLRNRSPYSFLDTLRSTMHRALCLCALVFYALQAWAQQPPNPSLSDSRQLLAQGKLDQALAKLDALSTQSPEPVGVERLRGFIFYQQNKFIEADAAFAKALAQDPKDMEAMQLRGVTLFRMGKAADAIPLLEQARSSVPSANIDPNYVLGVSYMQVARLDDARRAFAAQYGFAPESAPAYLLAARMFFHQENVPAAHASATKALQLNASLPLARQLLGEIALAAGDTTGAIAEFQKEAQINPLNGELYDRLGDAYLRNRQDTEAQHALNRAVLLEPNATGPYILLGKLMLNQQNAVMASMYLERARQMDPGNYMTHFLLGQAYRIEGRKDDAAREFHAAEQLQSSHPPKADEPH
jgi:tetratricopeptide (TPR) repeat protein